MFWAAGFSAAAMMISIVMVWQSWGWKSLPGCGAGSGCDEVSASRWARVGRFPVAGGGAMVYGGMLVCELFVGGTMGAAGGIAGEIGGIGGSLWMGLACMAAIALSAGVWFSSLQLFVIRRFCFYCMLTHGCGVASAVLVWVAWKHSARKPDEAISPAVFVGVAAMVGLAAGQILIRPKTYVVEHTPELSKETVSQSAIAVIAPAASGTNLSQASRKVELIGGQVVFDAERFPLIGSRDTKFLIADMLDYTCEHCRQVYPLLRQAIEHFDGELSVTILCTPQEDMFAPGMPVDPRYVNGHAFAHLSLAVWRENPRRFEEFHHWLLETGWRYSLETARGMAVDFVGELTLERALRDGNIKQSLDESMALYYQSDAGRLPKLLLPKAMVWGKVDSIDKLIWILEKELRGVDVSDRPA